MNGLIVLINLAGSVALLLWATRMVRTGVERAYGDKLKRSLRKVMGNPFLAAVFGLFMAVALQSSTAVTLLVSSFVSSGFVSGVAGLVAVRGAELGSALVVKILSFHLTLLVPLCLVIGTAIFMTTERREWRQLGRIIVGVGLLVLSLEMTGQATAPLRESGLLPIIISYLAGDYVSAFLIAAVLTYFFHSSIAGIVLLLSFAANGLISGPLAVVMVLGVNFGSSFIAPMLTRHAPPEMRVVPLGNLLMRGAGSILILILFMACSPSVSWLGKTTANIVVDAHIVFNILILLAGIPLSRLVLKVTEKIVHLRETNNTANEPTDYLAQSFLDETVLDKPEQALANVRREVMRICDIVDLMLKKIMGLYEKPDKNVMTELARLDEVLDRKHADVKLYLARLARNELSAEEALRTQELLSACIKLEQAGDIISTNMLALVKKKEDHRLEFTEEGWNELMRFHSIVLTNAHMAFNVLISHDTRTARLLVQEKDNLRTFEKETELKHFQRLRKGDEKSIETSSLHLDTIRDLKQVNALLTSIAYPILEEQGLLKSSRLKKNEAD